MSRTDEQNSEITNLQLTGEVATWRRRLGVASVGATVAATAILGSLILTSHQEASAAAPVSAGAVAAGLGFDDPPAPTSPADMPQDMPGMDMSGSSPTPVATDVPAMPQDMPGMDMSGSSPAPTPTEMPGNMPGMDMSGGHEHGAPSGAAIQRPLAPVLGTFGGGTAAVLLSAGMMRRKDREADRLKQVARLARRSGK